MNDEAVFRTAPATPGLLIISSMSQSAQYGVTTMFRPTLAVIFTYYFKVSYSTHVTCHMQHCTAAPGH